MPTSLVLLLVLALLTSSGALGTSSVRGRRGNRRSSARLPAFYTATSDFEARVKDLSQGCENAQVTTEHGLLTVTVKAGGEGGRPTRAFFVHGEHARELVSPELGLRLLSDLCTRKDGKNGRAFSPRRPIEVKIVPLANVKGRKLVEQGQFCRRTNEHFVDINRNWGSHWQPPTPRTPADSFPGKRPFSEPQTQALRDIMLSYRPDLFLSVHSGTRGLYSPPAFDLRSVAEIAAVDAKRAKQIETMGEILDILAQGTDIAHGGAAQTVGYPCPGNCLDFAHEHGVPFAFAFEIFGPPTVPMLAPAALAASIFLEQGRALSILGKGKRISGGEGDGEEQEELHEVTLGAASFLEVDSYAHRHGKNSNGNNNNKEGGGKNVLSALMTADECLRFFNPTTESEFTATLDEWSSRTLRLIDEVQKRMTPPPPAQGDKKAEEGQHH